MSEVIVALSRVLWPAMAGFVALLAKEAFADWLKARTAQAPSSDKELKDDIAKLKSQVNGLILNNGLRS